MSNEAATANGGGAPMSNATVALFQKAHAKMVTLQRIDEQLSALLEQRRKLQDELRGVQALINEEFDRVVRDAQEAPARLLAQFAGAGTAGQIPVAKRATKEQVLRMEVAEAV